MTRTFADIERSHERAMNREMDKENDRQDALQARIDSIVDGYWEKGSGYVEDAISENADVVANVMELLHAGAISRDDCAERLLSSIDYWLTNKVESEL